MKKAEILRELGIMNPSVFIEKTSLKDLQEDKDDLQGAFDTLILENNRLRAKIDKLQLALNIEREWSKRVEEDLEILKQWSEARVEESERKLNLLKKERDKLL